jgi:type VI secretion system protein ImpC
MQYEVSFGRLAKAAKPAGATPGGRFRIALLGDFSGRANAGGLASGKELAARKPLRVDVDTLDDVIARLKLSLSLTLAEGEGPVTVPLGGMDDFHPDQIAGNVDMFGELLTLRRNLASKTGFERAAKQVLSWGGEEPLPPPPRIARGTSVATDKKLSDFSRLIGRKAEPRADDAATEDLVRRLVGAFIEPARDSRQDQLLARVDEALSAAMRRVLHHPDFQAAEALWRGVELLVRRLETDSKFHLVLYDISAEEFAADLAASDALEESGLYKLLVEQPALDAQAGPISAVIGLYSFEFSPPHADLLGRAAQVTAAGGAPFIAGIRPDPMKIPFPEQHPLIVSAFEALRALPASAYLGLAAPRFLLRLPYGKKTDPIERFAFEEFTRQGGLGAMLWGEPALLPALLLGQAWSNQGAKLQPGSVLTAGDMAYYVYFDEDGDQTALPCTERMYSERDAIRVAGYRVMPLLSLRGRPEVRLGGFVSQGGKPIAGFWAPAPLGGAPAPAPASASASAPGPGPAPAATPAPAEAPAPQPGFTPVPEPAAAAPAAETPDAPAEDMADLDALLASVPAAAEASPEDDLDALLASLSAPPPAAAEDATEPDLDALLASLK